jgi:nucleotide-binding universal stress UspA family protein
MGLIPKTTLKPPIWLGTYSKELKKSSKKMLSEVLENAKKKKRNLNILTKLLDGRPAYRIVEEANDGHFDLIVIGNRGLGGITGFLLGSVSDRVVDNAKCPVLIVK